MATTTKVSRRVRAYKTEELEDLLEAQLDELEIDTKRLKRTMDKGPFNPYFRAQENMVKGLLDLEKVAEAAIAAEIAAGGDGSKAKIKNRRGTEEGAQAFLRNSRNITRGELITVNEMVPSEEGGDNFISKQVQVRQSIETRTYKTHADFVSRWLGKQEGKELGHIGTGNATFAAALYLSKMSKNAPRRPKVRYLLNALNVLDGISDEISLAGGEGGGKKGMMDVFDLIDKGSKVDVTSTLEKTVNIFEDKAGVDFTLMYEIGKFNQLKSYVSREILSEMRLVLDNQESVADGRRLSNVTGSETLSRIVKNQFIDAALGKAINTETTKGKAKKRADLGLGMKKKKAKLRQNQNKIKTALRRLQAVKATTASSRPPRSTGAGQADSIAPLMALLNQKLPQTVVKNMGPPGLENQTGRFASSARVTDVSRTAQGYPSIGYTYRRNPYQVFETGSGQAPWATPDRDPRKLIDASIREIAAQLAIGRFYTRRV